MKARELRALALLGVLAVGVILASGCIWQPEAPTQKPSAAAARELTAKEAFNLAYEHASAEFDNLYLRTLGSGGTVVGFRTGQAPVEGGRSGNWLVTFERKKTENNYTLVTVNIRGGVIPHKCSESKELEITEADWGEHARKRLVDISKWEVDSPRAVELAKQGADEGLGTMSFAVDYYYNIADAPVYSVILGPLTGDGGAGVTAYIDLTDGTVLKTGKINWR